VDDFGDGTRVIDNGRPRRMTIPTDRRPIGFWLALVDRLLDERLEQTLGDLTRRHWQVLNIVQQGHAGQREIDARLRPFLAGDATTVREIADLIERGWVEGTGTYALTDVGADAFRSLLDRVSADRARTMDGITAEEYATTVRTLERVARNLGWTATERA
jgi:DNA-binding MarR family transcriptional regulator